MQLNGFIKLHRKLALWGWYKDSAVKSVFLHLLIMANYAPSEWKGVTLMPGQLIAGRKSLAYDLGLSEQQIRTAIRKLKSTGEITAQATNKYTLITIVNWNEYQFNDYAALDFSAHGQPTVNRQSTTDKEDKEINNKRNKEYIYSYTDSPAHARTDAQTAHEIAERVRRRCAEIGIECK